MRRCIIQKEISFCLGSQSVIGVTPNGGFVYMKFSEAIPVYAETRGLEIKGVTLDSEVRCIKIFGMYMRDCDIEAVTEKDFVTFLNEMYQFEYKHNAIVTRCAVLRAFFRFFNKRGFSVISADSLPIMRKEYTNPRIATEENYQKLLNNMRNKNAFVLARDKAMIRLLWDSWCRAGELVSINTHDVDIKQRCAIIKTEKSRGKKPFRKIFWTEDTNHYLKEWMKVRNNWIKNHYCEDPEALFVGSTQNWQGKRLTGHAVGIALRRYSNQASIPNLNPHSFRHRGGHFLAQSGASANVIASMLGHSRVDSSFRYTDLTAKEQEEMYRKITGGK